MRLCKQKSLQTFRKMSDAKIAWARSGAPLSCNLFQTKSRFQNKDKNSKEKRAFLRKKQQVPFFSLYHTILKK